jgi:hypothetical protein
MLAAIARMPVTHFESALHLLPGSQPLQRIERSQGIQINQRSVPSGINFTAAIRPATLA